MRGITLSNFKTVMSSKALHLHIKIKSNSILDLNIKCKTINILEENTGENLHYLELDEVMRQGTKSKNAYKKISINRTSSKLKHMLHKKIV